MLRAMRVVRALLTPGRMLSLVFAAAILAGAGLLLLPGVMRDGHARLSPSDALFMATSAICVTGLTVRDLAHFTGFGQALVLLLIQVGGIGIITLSKLTLLRASRQLRLGDRDLVDLSFGHLRRVGPREVLASTVAFTIACEVAGAVLLAPAFILDHGFVDGVWAAAFHSISAFCNAGFSLWSEGLTGYRGHWWVNAVVMALIVSGGLGFVVIGDVIAWLRRRRTAPNARLSLHSRTVLLTSGLLIVGGWILFLVLESLNPLGPVHGDPLPSLFLSVSARTAGFSTVPLDTLCAPSLLVMILLMAIGGSPGSTAGGIKTTALAALFAAVRARALGRPEAELLGRSIGAGVVGRALGAAAMMLAVIMIGTGALIIAQTGLGPHAANDTRLLDHLFEVVSAVGTVGLTTGVTATLNEPGRLVIEACMFIGRLGPLLLATTLLSSTRAANYRLPREDLIIG